MDLKQRREALRLEAEAWRARAPPTAAEILEALDGSVELPEHVKAQHKAEVETMIEAVRSAAARRRKQEELQLAIVAGLRDGLHEAAACVQRRHELEHAALQTKHDALVPSALKAEWCVTEADMQSLQGRLRRAQERCLASLEVSTNIRPEGTPGGT